MLRLLRLFALCGPEDGEGGSLSGGDAPAALEAPAEKPSMDETIMATLKDIRSRETEGEEAETPAKPAGNRDASGKFTKALEQTPAQVTTPAATTEIPHEQAAKLAEAPKSWKPEQKAQWATLPDSIKQEVHRREEDFHKGIEQYRVNADRFKEFDAIIRPHADVIRNLGVTAQENVGNLLALQSELERGTPEQKLNTVLQICESVGIDSAKLVEALQNPQARPAQDPRYDTLARETQQLREMLSQVQIQPVLSQVDAFLSDPKNEFAAELQESMLKLIESGLAKTMQEAYDKACSLHDGVRQKLEARKSEAEAKRKADLAAKAKQASSINVKPRGVTAGQAAKGTMEDTIRATLTDIRKRNGG